MQPHCSTLALLAPVGQLNNTIYPYETTKTPVHPAAHVCWAQPCHPATLPRTCASPATAGCWFPEIQPGRQREAHSPSWCVTLGQDTTSTCHYSRLHSSYVQTDVAGIAQYSLTPHLLSIYFLFYLSYSTILISHFAFAARLFIHFRFSPPSMLTPASKQRDAPPRNIHPSFLTQIHTGPRFETFEQLKLVPGHILPRAYHRG